MQKILITLLVIAFTHTLSANNYIEHVSVRYKDEDAFKRISEYFTGKENYGFRVISRSQANERSGMYWILTLNRLVSELPKGSTIKLEYYILGDPELKSHTFNIDTARNSTAIYAGITGSDWSDPDKTSNAWKLSIQDANGQVIESRKSYLWELP